jgi:hypothetical protein
VAAPAAEADPPARKAEPEEARGVRLAQTTALTKPTAETAVRPSPAVEAAPPVTPNLVRRKEIPGARRVGRNILETLLFRGLSTPVALLLVVIQGRPSSRRGAGLSFSSSSA